MMPISECDCCGGDYQWSWIEAFDKFGFNDGDGQVETWQVESVLTKAGYAVEVTQWGLHNSLIVSIKQDGIELTPQEDTGTCLGYDNPRDYLPKEIIHLLDRELPDAENGE